MVDAVANRITYDDGIIFKRNTEEGVSERECVFLSYYLLSLNFHILTID